MNVIRGLDRIALVIAIIAILPGFVLGANVIREELKRLTPEYQEWLNKLGKKEGDILSIDEFLSEGPTKYQYPPAWQCITAGIMSAPLSFLVVLYSLRGMTRGTRWFALWIIEGFKDEKKGKPDKHIGQRG